MYLFQAAMVAAESVTKVEEDVESEDMVFSGQREIPNDSEEWGKNSRLCNDTDGRVEGRSQLEIQ